MINLLDRICGMYKYSTSPNKAIYAELRSVDDFVVEEILRDGTIVSIENPKLGHSGYPGLFTHFVLVKRNVDTFVAIHILSRKLNIPRNLFFLSGLKDKEAITAQKACVFSVSPKQLEGLNLPDNIKIFSPIRELRRVSIGDHWGNRFTIRLWYVRGDIENIINDVIGTPILNFYGYQRFGLWKPINHIVGKMLLQGLYEEALIIFLKEINPLFRNRKVFLDLLEDGKYLDALKLLPRHKFWFERWILKEFIHRRGVSRIFSRMPSSLLRLMIEAYQSFLFNLILSNVEDYPQKLPLVGYKLDLTTIDKPLRYIFKEILDSEEISLEIFRKHSFKLRIARGGFRRCTIQIKDFLCKKKEDGYIIRFSLPKGSFATIILRELTKENLLWLLLGRKRNQYGDITKLYHDMKSYYQSLLSKYYVGEHLRNFTT